jgi:hypothetical protein
MQSALVVASLSKVLEIEEAEIRKLENVVKTRNQPMPGVGSLNKDLAELY